MDSLYVYQSHTKYDLALVHDDHTRHHLQKVLHLTYPAYVMEVGNPVRLAVEIAYSASLVTPQA